jgi:GrpB-like predicted nucleotidyltransferase (UPF0157 family)
MTVKILNFSEDLTQRFALEKARLTLLLGADVRIEHVGSSAVGIGGKNIVDILIGVPDREAMMKTKNILIQNGYFSGNDDHADRVFLASRKEETGENDVHIHICPIDSATFCDFLILRDYLRKHPAIAKSYFDKKKEIAVLAQNNRKEYKRLKSQYVSKLLEVAKQEK